MCFFGGGGGKPADPPPPTKPPEPRNMQPTPTSPESNNSSGQGDGAKVAAKRKGRNLLRIPLVNNNSGGSGVQIPV